MLSTLGKLTNTDLHPFALECTSFRYGSRYHQCIRATCMPPCRNCIGWDPYDAETPDHTQEGTSRHGEGGSIIHRR